MLIYEIFPIVFIYVITAYDNIFTLHLFMGLYCLPDVSRHFPYKNSDFFLNSFTLCDSALILHCGMYRNITSVRVYDITRSLGCIWLYWLCGRAVCQTVECELSVCCNVLFSRWLWRWLMPSMLCIQAVQMTGSCSALGVQC